MVVYANTSAAVKARADWMVTSSIGLDPAGFVTVTWPSVPGKTYRVMYKNNWSDTAWTNLRSDVTADSSTASQSDYVVGNRFYQVIELP